MTGDVSGAGTDANVFIILFGQYGDCGELALKHSESHKDKFERNHTDVFVFKNIYSLGECTRLIFTIEYTPPKCATNFNIQRQTRFSSALRIKWLKEKEVALMKQLKEDNIISISLH